MIRPADRPKVNVLTSQRQRLLDHLRAGRSIHFLQAMQMDIPLLTDRIRELQERGLAIQAKPVRIGRIACTEYSMRQSFHLRALPADGYSWARLLVNDEWLIECTYTIVGSTRVCLHQEGDITLSCNWCAGDQPHHIMYLVNCALGYLRAADVDLMPLCSREKPFSGTRLSRPGSSPITGRTSLISASCCRHLQSNNTPLLSPLKLFTMKNPQLADKILRLLVDVPSGVTIDEMAETLNASPEEVRQTFSEMMQRNPEWFFATHVLPVKGQEDKVAGIPWHYIHTNGSQAQITALSPLSIIETMNKHNLTAPAPSRSLGCLIMLCLLAAIAFLLSTCSGKNFNGRRTDAIAYSHYTGIFQGKAGETSLFALPDGLDVGAFFKDSCIGRRIASNPIAIGIIKQDNTVTEGAVTAVSVNRTAIPLSLIDDAPTRTTRLWNQLLYLFRSTWVHLLFVYLLSFKTTVQKHWQAYNENPGFEPGPLEAGFFYNRHIDCLFDGQPLQPLRCTSSEHSA